MMPKLPQQHNTAHRMLAFPRQLQTIMVTNEHHLMWKRKEGGKEGRSTHLGKGEVRLNRRTILCG